MIPTPQITPIAQAWEAELAAAEKRSEAFLRALEKERREAVMRAEIRDPALADCWEI